MDDQDTDSDDARVPKPFDDDIELDISEFVDAETGKMLRPALNLSSTNKDAIVFRSLPKQIFCADAYSRLLLNASLNLTIPLPKLPWETACTARIAEPPCMRLGEMFSRPNLGSTTIWRHGTTAEVDSQTTRKSSFFPVAVRRLRDLRPQETEDALRNRAYGRWLFIISIAPEHSAIGRGLVNMIGHMSPNAALLKSVDDLCARKAPSTVAKRAGSIMKYLMFCKKHSLRGLPFNEQECLFYCEHLESSSEAAATSIASFKQALNFAGAIMQFDGAASCAANPRIAGMMHKKLLTKRMLKQSSVYTYQQIKVLMLIVISESVDTPTRIFAGQILFCIFSRSRWGDHQWIAELIWDVQYSGRFHGYAQGNTLRTKTAVTAQQRRMFTPLTAPLWDFTDGEDEPWWKVWQQLRDAEGLIVKAGTAFFPAPKISGGWCQRALSAGEASVWVREIFSVHDIPCPNLSSHGCKATLLSWCAKYGLEPPVRLALGYHKGAATDTLLHYSRDALSGPLAQLNMVISKVVAGKFCPDNNRAAYFPSGQPGGLVIKQTSISMNSEQGRPKRAKLNHDGSATVDDASFNVPCVEVSMDENSWEDIRELMPSDILATDEGAGSAPSEPRLQFPEPDPTGLPEDNTGAEDELLEAISDASESSSDSTDSDVDEEAAVDDVLGQKAAAKDGMWLHTRLGTLHKVKEGCGSRLACGRQITAAYRCADKCQFSWTKCRTCFQ